MNRPQTSSWLLATGKGLATPATLARTLARVLLLTVALPAALVSSQARGDSEVLAAPETLAAMAGQDVDFKIQVATSRPSIAAGSDGEAVLTLSPPSGVHVNRYPPMRLTLETTPPLTLDETTIKVGLDAMPKDPEKNAFETIDPIHIRFHVGAHASDGKIPVKGKLRFYYCVARSGYCAPGSKDVSFTVPVSAGP